MGEGPQNAAPISKQETAYTEKTMDIKVISAMDAPNIEIDQADVERMTGNKGPTVADIIVNHENGRTTRFFITVSINRQGRAVCEVSSNGPSAFSKEIRKSVCGHKHKPS